MNRYKLLIAGLLAVAVALLALTLWPSKPSPEAGKKAKPDVAQGETGRTGVAKKTAKAERAKRDAQRSREGVSPEPIVTAGAPAQAEPAARQAEQAATAEKKQAREKAVEAWESLIDRVIEQKNILPQDQAPIIKEAFDKLDKEDQMDGIQRSLNLLPDEQFPALYGILLDKAENAEVLDAIFSDALNRPEDLKNPLMKQLVKDKEHPCFFESARILDIIGELEVRPAPTPSP